MQINSVNISNYNSQSNFKSAYPVTHWLKTGENKYSPVVTEKLNHKFQNILVRLLNGTGSKNDSRIQLSQRAKKFVANRDSDYAKNPIARSYYNKSNEFTEIPNFLITGDDVALFEEKYGKPIGKAKNEAPKINNKKQSAEISIALSDYIIRGLNFVKSKFKKFIGKDGNQKTLHVIFEPITTKKGAIKNYKVIDMKFLNTQGTVNPLVEMGYKKS